AISNYNAKMSVQQPLLNFDVFAARHDLSRKIKALQHQKEYAEALLTVEMKKAYTNLQCLYEAGRAGLPVKEAYQEVLRNTEHMKELGYAKISDVLMVQVGLNEVENREIEIRNNIQNLSDFISWLMGNPLGTQYKPVDSLSRKILLDDQRGFSENLADNLAMIEGVKAQNKMVIIKWNAVLIRQNACSE